MLRKNYQFLRVPVFALCSLGGLSFDTIEFFGEISGRLVSSRAARHCHNFYHHQCAMAPHVSTLDDKFASYQTNK
jgi:hypothetical protein